MQKIYVAAGALLLGTSALAYAADKNADPVGESIAESTVEAMNAAKPTPIDAYADTRWAPPESEASLALASSAEPIDKSALGEPVSAKFETGDYAESSDAVVRSKLALASAKPNPAVPAEVHAAVGGPLKEESTTLVSLAPRPAAANYPPCEPGPGDDNCIQLYETGVRAQLASWNTPTGGLADGSATTAMGGPFEPLAGHADASATGKVDGDAAVHDRMIDTSVAEPQGVPLGYAEPEAARLDAAEPAIVASHPGVGGPVASQSGYPPCEPGAGDDRCIQLYERGVTGAGN